MKIHRSLLLVRAEVTLIEELLSDSKISQMVVSRPADDTLAVLRRNHDRLVERMKKLGHGHREIGKW